MTKQLISVKDAATKLAELANGKVWDKKQGEIRVYVQGTKNGYLRVAPETATTAQVQYFMKSYDIPKVKSIVEAFDEAYEVSASVANSGAQKVLWQEDEDGIIAPAGQHEPGVHIVREWYQ